MSDELLFLSRRFARWCTERRPSDGAGAYRKDALSLLVDCINNGEITSFDGVNSPISQRIKANHRTDTFEMNSHWIGSYQDWSCPCCCRNKFQITRLGRKGQILAKLVIHHDHMGDALQAAFHAAFVQAGTSTEQATGQRLVENMAKAFAAYEEVLICEDCNNADAEAKKGVDAPQYFSFSIGQIRRFIQIEDHHPHLVNFQAAGEAWSAARSAYDLRMTMIKAVARAATTDAHWYEPYERGTRPVPVYGIANRIGDTMVKDWVSFDALCSKLGHEPVRSDRNLSRWRSNVQKAGPPLPPNYLAMLRSEEAFAKSWDAMPDKWACPICQRAKHDVVYVGDKGKVVFFLSSNPGRGAWSAAPKTCRQCFSILMSLKLEIAQLMATQLPDSYGFVSPDELARIVIPRPHSAHAVDRAQSADLVERIQIRLQNAPLAKKA